MNHGYAFINFTSNENFGKFKEHFGGFGDWSVPSDRLCEVSLSDKFNTLEDHVENYRNSPMMHESVEDRFKPVLFEDGQRVPFPAPTKKIQKPRQKRVLCPRNTDWHPHRFQRSFFLLWKRAAHDIRSSSAQEESSGSNHE